MKMNANHAFAFIFVFGVPVIICNQVVKRADQLGLLALYAL
jgi:hypothetical protein